MSRCLQKAWHHSQEPIHARCSVAALRARLPKHPKLLNCRDRSHRQAMCSAQTSEKEAEVKSDEYSTEMQSKMGGVLTYQHEDGMNFAHILDDMIVGSCLQTPADLDRLVEEEGVGSILCLQQDSDMEYFSLDLKPILARVQQRGDVHHIRRRINDFDAFDLRMRLPVAAATLAREVAQGRKVYIHCTAGMGRAPATALAYMYWYRGFTLEDAFEKLRAVRPCNPRLQAVRQATVDTLHEGGSPTHATISVGRPGLATKIEIAGLDFGWGNRKELQWDSQARCYSIRRSLPPGKYPFKLVYGDRWTISADHPTFLDGDTVNNYIEVVGTGDPKVLESRSRLLSEGGTLNSEERELLVKQLDGLDLS